METVEANLNIELNVTCPHCDDYFDLFDFDNGRVSMIFTTSPTLA